MESTAMSIRGCFAAKIPCILSVDYCPACWVSGTPLHQGVLSGSAAPDKDSYSAPRYNENPSL